MQRTRCNSMQSAPAFRCSAPLPCHHTSMPPCHHAATCHLRTVATCIAMSVMCPCAALPMQHCQVAEDAPPSSLYVPAGGPVHRAGRSRHAGAGCVQRPAAKCLGIARCRIRGPGAYTWPRCLCRAQVPMQGTRGTRRTALVTCGASLRHALIQCDIGIPL